MFLDSKSCALTRASPDLLKGSYRLPATHNFSPLPLLLINMFKSILIAPN